MASLALGVRFNPVSAGTADFVYSGSVTGYTNPTGLTDGKTYRYRAESGDLSQWEWGSGVWTAGTTTLARTTVLLSSNSNSKVSFTVAPQVSIVIFPADVIQFDDAMSLTAAQQLQARANINAGPNKVYAESTTFTTGTSTMAGVVNSAPQITDGTNILTSPSITPTLSTSKLLIRVEGCFSSSATSNMWFAIFQGSTAAAIASSMMSVGAAGNVIPVSLTVEVATGSTSAVAFSVNIGNFTGLSNTWAINGTNGGARLGATMRWTITVEEVKG